MEDKKYIKFDIPEWVNWLARESNGDLYGYRNKPNKGVATWCIGPVNVEQINCHLVSDDPNIYPQVKWEDGAAKRYKDGIICVDVEVDDLTDEEIDFINDDQPTVEEGLEMNDVKFDIPEWVNWLARDNNGALYGYRNKPVEGLDMWGVTGDSNDFEEVVVSFITDDLEYYPQVKWNDEEPTRIKDGITLPYEPSELDTNEAITALQSFGNTLTDIEKLRFGLKSMTEIREGYREPMKKYERHSEITKQLNEIYIAKNTDYGDAFGDTFKKLGIISAVTRIADKTNRLMSLSAKTEAERNVKDETIKDTLMDLANYALMTLIEMEELE